MRFLIPDVLVALWLTAGLYFFLVAYEQEEPSRWACWELAITVALNVLTRGLIGLVFSYETQLEQLLGLRSRFDTRFAIIQPATTPSRP